MTKFTVTIFLLFLAAIAARVHSRAVPEKVKDLESNVIIVDNNKEIQEEFDLDKKIAELREKVKVLIAQGKDNQKAFTSMTEQVQFMDQRVRDMTERLRKINNQDYLNTPAEELKNL